MIENQFAYYFSITKKCFNLRNSVVALALAEMVQNLLGDDFNIPATTLSAVKKKKKDYLYEF